MNDSTALKSILLMAANPKRAKSLRLQEEEREIKEQLRLVVRQELIDGYILCRDGDSLASV